MLEFTDQTGRRIQLQDYPTKIISIVPSQTELLFSIGLNEEVVGITKFCIHPDSWYHLKTRVGGTKQLNMEVIDSLMPDLIIANKEENVKEQVEHLMYKYPVWVSDINNLEDAYEMIGKVGLITNREKQACSLISQIKMKFESFEANKNKPAVIYLIWNKPYMTVGGDTFINSMLHIAGFTNLYEKKQRYPEISIEQMKEGKPDLIFLSSEPFPFKQKHVDELQLLLPNAKIILVDGEMFSWYGSRLQHAPAYFNELQLQIQPA